MGYTHYWTMTRNLSADAWAEVSTDIAEILKYVEHTFGLPLGDGSGDAHTRPLLDSKGIDFNGLGDDSHESFVIGPKRVKTWEHGTLGSNFCKTAHKPYDIAVTACLCYLDSCLEPRAFSVSSDGYGHNFLDGLEAARQALPRKANVLDIPLGVRENDRWTGPWICGSSENYQVKFCVNGKAYVLHAKESRCFPDHASLGVWLDARKVVTFRQGGTTGWGGYGRTEPNIWDATGSFDKARHDRIAKAQARILAPLFNGLEPDSVTHDQPPAFVRPGDLPRPEDAGTFHYDLAALIGSVGGTKEAA